MKSKVIASVAGLVGAFLLNGCGKAGEEFQLLSQTPLIDERISITVDFESGKVVERGYEWVDNGGIVHVQGRVIEGCAITGDLTGKFKVIVANSERHPRTGNSKERLIVEFPASWPAQKRNGVFAGEMKLEITDGVRTVSTLQAQGQEGFAKLNLEANFKNSALRSGLLVGEGRITEH